MTTKTMTTKTMTKTMVILLTVVFCSNCSLLQVVAIEMATPDDVAGIITTTTTGSGSATATTASSSFNEEAEQEIRNAVSSSSSSSSSPLKKKRKKQWMNIGGPSYSSANTNIDDAESNDNLEWILTDHSVNSFDVYSKVTRTMYSQVHWTNHGTIPLPSDVIERYSTTYSSGNSTINKSSDTIAIVGYEVDQVMMIVDKGGQEKEVPVPITWAYNHHYMAYLMGEDDESESEDIVAAQAQRMIEYHRPDHSLEHLNSNNNWIFISEGNGGEMRKSYHCYPTGYAQLIKRPTSFSITPMQIDTWNRNLMNHTGIFVPPSNIEVDKYMLPKSSQIRDLHKSNYNPIMECPCSDRLKKRLEMTYILRDYLQHQGDVVVEDNDNDNGNDNDKQLLLDNSTECFNVAVQLLPSTNVTKRIIISNNDTNNDEVVEGHCIATFSSKFSLSVSSSSSSLLSIM
jgi:hypothetical protein